MRVPRLVRFYFDFISPYSYLASHLIAWRSSSLGASIAFEYRPVVFGTMLAKLGARGPGEIPSRRRAGLEDVLLLADAYDIPFEGPPVHPFNSIYALRSVCAVADERMRGRLVSRYFEEAWAKGRSLEDLAVLRECLARLGVPQDPEEAASDPENRKLLKAYTAEALDAGAWGVPTFAIDGLLFYGHDRLDLLVAYVEGRARLSPGKVEALLARPQPGRIT